MAIEPGCYLDSNNYSALVFLVKPEAVYFVANEDGHSHDVHAMETEHFARRYRYHLNSYPMRRCARVYMESPMPKTERATKVLKHILRS